MLLWTEPFIRRCNRSGGGHEVITGRSLPTAVAGCVSPSSTGRYVR